MAKTKPKWQSPNDWNEYLAAGLDARHRWRLPVLMFGILFARGRRTVTSWLRAAGISTDYEPSRLSNGACRKVQDVENK